MDKLDIIQESLNRQYLMIQELTWQVVGSPTRDIEGLRPCVKRLETEVHSLNKWKYDQEMDRGKVSVVSLMKIAGYGTVVIAIVTGILTLYDRLFK